MTCVDRKLSEQRANLHPLTVNRPKTGATVKMTHFNFRASLGPFMPSLFSILPVLTKFQSSFCLVLAHI